MIDSFGRTIDYLRISVTDRCDLRCQYCMPDGGVALLPHDDILSFEEICDFTRIAVGEGVRKVRLTGGEPLVKRSIVTLVDMLAAIDGLDELAMTTNAQQLVEFAAPLAAAGLTRVNVSLDTTDPDRYREITRGGDVGPALAGIDAAIAAGLTPVKLNCVVGEWSIPTDLESVRAFAAPRGLQVRTISHMQFQSGEFAVVDGGTGGDCPRCNRLRLRSNGELRPCLLSDLAWNIRELGGREALRCAIESKPQAGGTCSHSGMHTIGG